MDGARTALTTALWRSFRNGDFEEQDVWNVLNDDESTTTSTTTSYHSNFSTADSSFLPSASRMIPRPNGGVGGQIGLIPQWLKSERSKNPRNRIRKVCWDEEDDEDGVEGGGHSKEEEEEEEEEGEGIEKRVPPHELIAKRLARAQISSFSVFEGAGRTLKGRDLSKVRNAVLTKTGFLESI